MPEYLAPGVFVEETSFRQKTIEGVSTSTTGFVGPTRFGPIGIEPPLLTSFSDFERIYGGLDQLEFQPGTPTHNYLAHAVRAYFEEGGKRLYVARAFNEQGTSGIAQWSDDSPSDFSLEARYPGSAGNFTVAFQFKLGPNILNVNEGTLQGTRNYDVVLVEEGSPSTGDNVYWVDQSRGRNEILLRRDNGVIGADANDIPQEERRNLDGATTVRLLTVSVTVGKMGRFEEEKVWEDLTFDPRRQKRDSLSQIFEPEGQETRRSTSLFVPLVFTTDLGNGALIAEALHRQADSSRRFQVTLEGGNDGERPTQTAYEGDSDDPKSGLRAFEDIENISIVAAPGSTHIDNNDTSDQVIRLLLAHCERMRYRVAVLDSRNGHTPGEVQTIRGQIDSTRGALYYPWVRVFDPITETEIFLPPSGFVTGIYARNDVERGVHKAPANEVIRLALEFELLINKAQQEVLNPLGINCLRFFEGRGFRIWGARTVTSDPEWKYLNVRRYFAFLERSIEKGTQWTVFENNGPVLWANVRSTIEDFLFNEWKENHLLGTTPEQAYFVRCDLSTMTQNDLDNGRLICLVGVSPLRPAEFVIFRIGQKTLDSQS